jgi:peptidoglycan/LPS O-acetylase OafA/YrhL
VNAFLRARSLRLGKAFLFAAFVLSPLAYYATYRQIGMAHPSAGFWKQWFALGSWPAGPAWFLWLLLAFDLLAAGLFRFVPQRTEALAKAFRNCRPSRLFVLLTLLSTVCFTPMALHFGSMSWSTFGPFSVQTSRIFHYLAYFIAGLLLGAAGLESSVLHSGSALARRWWAWLAASLVSFLLMVGLALAAMREPPSVLWGAIVSFTFCLSCATATFAVLAVFLRFVNGKGRVWEALGGASFGVYIVHYAFVSWIQYWLVPSAIPAIAKAAVVTSGALLLSLGLVHGWKRLMSNSRNSVGTGSLQDEMTTH